MKPELSQKTGATMEEAEHRHRKGTMMFSSALTSLGFLVLEGVVCFFSQRTDPWHGYLWFITVAGLGTGLWRNSFAPRRGVPRSDSCMLF